MLKQLSGKGVERKIDEYTEVYGEVLLGMHRNILEQRELIDDYTGRMSEMLDTAAGHADAVARDKSNLERTGRRRSKELNDLLDDSRAVAESVDRKGEELRAFLHEEREAAAAELAEKREELDSEMEALRRRADEMLSELRDLAAEAEEHGDVVRTSIANHRQEMARGLEEIDRRIEEHTSEMEGATADVAKRISNHTRRMTEKIDDLDEHASKHLGQMREELEHARSLAAEMEARNRTITRALRTAVAAFILSILTLGAVGTIVYLEQLWTMF